MKIFSWMQSKLQLKKKGHTLVAANNHVGQSTSNEEFNDWPQSILSIGTFGFITMRSDPEEIHPQTPTLQQVQELITYVDAQEEEEEEDDDNEGDEEPQPDPVFEDRQADIFSRGKELLVDHKNSTAISKKSLKFLLKKIFTSRNRLHHVSLVRDSLPEPTLIDKSRIEQILRTILNKKIHPRNSPVKLTPNKHLVTNDISMDDHSDDETVGSMWVKTDSEYIVLEI